jgi:hypothetical protein
MMGKVIGIGMVGLTQFLMWVLLSFVVSTVGLSFFASNIASGAAVVENAQVMQTGMDQAVMMNELMNNQAINWFFQINWTLMIGLFLFYFIGGYFLYASLFAAIGAAVDSETDTQQFMAPASAQQKPPPELIQAMAKMQNEAKEADARMLDAQTRAAESQAKLELEAARLQNEMGGGAVDQEKMASLQVQQMEIQQRHTDTMLDAINRKRDRESRERLSAIKLAEEAMRNPQGLGVAQQFLDPNMIQRLEANEPTLDGTKTGEL